MDRKTTNTKLLYARRLHSRVPVSHSVWVFWHAHGRDDTSRVRDLSLGGLFVETDMAAAVGTPTRLDFLVQEGTIRADAVVRHVHKDRGVGLKFTAVREEDRERLSALMNRLRSSS